MMPAHSRPHELVVPGEDQSLASLLSKLSKETTQLIVQQTALARIELESKLAEAKQGAIALATSSVLALSGLLVLLLAAGFGLGEVLPLWAAFLIVGLSVLGIGAALGLVGKRKLDPERLNPAETRAMLQTDKEFVKEQF